MGSVKKPAKAKEETALAKTGDNALSTAVNIEERWLGTERALVPHETATLQQDRLAIKAAYEEIEEKRRELVDPLNGVVKKLNALAKPWKDRLDRLDDHLTHLLDLTTEERRKQEAKAVARDVRAAEKQGADQLAGDLRAKAASVVPEGLGAVVTWKAEVTNIEQLVRAVADRDFPIRLVLPNLDALDDMAAADLPMPPGVTRVAKTSYPRRPR